MKEENKNLIDKLFTSIEQRVKDHEKSNKLSKCTRIRHQNGRILDMFLLYLSNNTASISFVDVETKVEVSTIDMNQIYGISILHMKKHVGFMMRYLKGAKL